MTRKQTHGRRRIALAIATGAVIAGLALLVDAVRSSPPAQQVVTTNPVQAATPMTTADLQTLSAARAEAREQRRDAKYVLPSSPPPVGLPATATKLPTQPDQPMPTPRGSYDLGR